MNINNRLISVSSNVFILQQFHTFEKIAASLGIEFCKDAVFLCLSEKDLQLARGQDLSAHKLNDIQSLGHQFEIDNFSHSHKFIQNLLAQSPDFTKYVVYSCSSDLLPEMAWVFALTRNAKKILLGTNKKFVVFLYRGRANDLLLFDEKEQIKNQNEISFDLEKKVGKAPFFNFFSSFQGFFSQIKIQPWPVNREAIPQKVIKETLLFRGFLSPIKVQPWPVNREAKPQKVIKETSVFWGFFSQIKIQPWPVNREVIPHKVIKETLLFRGFLSPIKVQPWPVNREAKPQKVTKKISLSEKIRKKIGILKASRNFGSFGVLWVVFLLLQQHFFARGRNFTRKTYRRTFSLARKTYKKTFSLARKTYKKTFSLARKTYKRTFSLTRRIYKRTFSLTRKTYKRLPIVTRKIYKRTFSFIRKTYRRTFSLARKTYRRIFSLTRKIYKRLPTFTRKTYRRTFNFTRKTYRRTFNFTRKTYRRTFGFIRKAYKRMDAIRREAFRFARKLFRIRFYSDLWKKLSRKSQDANSLGFSRYVVIVWSYFHKDPVAIHVTNSLNQLQLQMITQIANKLIVRKKNVLVLHEGLDKGDLKNFKGCAFYNVLPIKRMHFESNFYKKLSLSLDNTPVLNAFSPQKWQRFMNSQAAKIIFFNSFFGSIKCSKLLTYPYGTNLGRAMRAGANLANVESYSLVTVMFAAHDRSFPVLEPYTKFLLYGQDGKELFLNRGIKEKNILVTGNPAYDEISMRKTAYVGSSSGKLKILIATSGIDKLDRSWLSIFQKLIRGWDVEVRLRPHPAVGTSQYQWIVSRNRQFSFSSYSLEEDINWSDVLLSDFSHVIVVCALLQRRMILINFSGQDFALRWDLKLKVPLVKNKVEFEDALTLLANEDSQHAPNSGTEYSTEGINYRNDGNALVRIVDALS